MIRWYVLALIALQAGCAQPVAPSGGPVDKTPPDLIAMYPPSNSVDFDGDIIRFEFSERVDKASFDKALTIVPELSNTPKLHWKGRELEMTFQAPLSEATTYVFTIDNSLRDERGVSIREPIVRAIATGPVIDSGLISGRLLGARSGKPVPNIDVIATRTDTTGSGTPPIEYRTQTGSDGVFRLKFLPRAPFALSAFEDRNRSRSHDDGEQFAVSPHRNFLPASEDSLDHLLDWWLVNPDTTRPVLTEARARSSRRIELRYSEPVHLDSLAPQVWMLQDTASGAAVVVQGVYLNPKDRRRLVLMTDSLASSTYRIEAFATVRDTSENAADDSSHSFEVSAVADTMRLHLIGFEPQTAKETSPIPLTSRQDPGLQFNQYVAPDRLRGALTVADTLGIGRDFLLDSPDGTLWRLRLSPAIQPGETVRISVDGALFGVDSTLTTEFRRLSLDETGSLAGRVESEGDVVVEIYAERGENARPVAVSRTSGDYSIGDLAVGNYKLRMFGDVDGDGVWDWGQIDPYVQPEVMQWYPDSARVRAGWETVLDTLRLGPVPEE